MLPIRPPSQWNYGSPLRPPPRAANVGGTPPLCFSTPPYYVSPFVPSHSSPPPFPIEHTASFPGIQSHGQFDRRTIGSGMAIESGEMNREASRIGRGTLSTLPMMMVNGDDDVAGRRHLSTAMRPSRSVGLSRSTIAPQIYSTDLIKSRERSRQSISQDDEYRRSMTAGGTSSVRPPQANIQPYNRGATFNGLKPQSSGVMFRPRSAVPSLPPLWTASRKTSKLESNDYCGSSEATTVSKHASLRGLMEDLTDRLCSMKKTVVHSPPPKRDSLSPVKARKLCCASKSASRSNKDVAAVLMS